MKNKLDSNDIKLVKEGVFYTVFYKLFQSSFISLYKNVTIIGRENIQKDEAIMLTVNHQNTMMDAMVILFTTKNPHPYYVARADIFKKSFYAKVLGMLKVLPIYRIRDGKESLQHNEAITAKTIKILKAGIPFTIYPEGSHDGHRHLRSVKKGVARTAFTALDNFPEGKKLNIVPTGLEYHLSYEKAMQDVIVNYSRPICVNDYYELYKEDPARAERQLQLKIEERMSESMIDIKSLEYYDFCDIARELACGEVMQDKGVQRNPEQRFYAQQEIVRALNKAVAEDETPFVELKPKAYEYSKLLKKINLRDWLFDKEKHNICRIIPQMFIALLLFPYALFGRATSGLQYLLINKLANGMKDPQWRSSLRFVLGFTLMPITHLILGAATFFFSPCVLWYILAVVAMAFGGYFSLMYEVNIKKGFAKIRYNRLMKNPTSDFKRLLELRNDINSFVRKTMTSNQEV